MNGPARPQTWGELGPAMQALNERQRAFVRHLVTGPVGHGRLTKAYRLAGYQSKGGKPTTLSKEAHSLSRDERIIAAVRTAARLSALVIPKPWPRCSPSSGIGPTAII